MTRVRIGWLVLLALIIALVIWIARHTYWSEVKVPMPPKGEAATNPFYVPQHFAAALGARTRWSRGISLPPPGGVAYVSAWQWDLSQAREDRIERWVQSGGRLVVDDSLITGGDSFERWSGIGHRQLQPAAIRRLPAGEGCPVLVEDGGEHDSYQICGLSLLSSLTVPPQAEWVARNAEAGIEAARVRIGAGSVTVINGTPFEGTQLFTADNARLFVAATGLRRGDEIHFFSEAHHASLLALAWELGWPVIGLLALLLVLMAWRSGVRFGPLLAPPSTARRSLAEQIRGTGRFALRIGSAGALRAATARALHEAATLHLRDYRHLPPAQRPQALALASGYQADEIAAALAQPDSRHSMQGLAAIQLLEATRRRILLRNTGPGNGNRQRHYQ